jgi:hypothetical protein
MAMTTLINFDDLSSGTFLSDQYSGVTFSSEPGNFIMVLSQPDVPSKPNIITPVNSNGEVDGTLNLNVDFAQPVNDLSFSVVFDNTVGAAAKIDVYTTITGAPITVDLITDGDRLTPDLVDLSSFTNITRISVNNITDPGGFPYDDFQFNFAPVSLAPVAVDDSTTTAFNTAVTISASTLLANDTDPGSNPISITDTSDAINGTVVLDDNGTTDNLADDFIVFTPTTGLGGDLTGGGGSDTFIFAALDGTDTISDFSEGLDYIGLSGGLTFGDLSFCGSSIIVTDTNELLATLTGINTTTLTAADFVSGLGL